MRLQVEKQAEYKPKIVAPNRKVGRDKIQLPVKPSRTIQEIINDIWDNRDRDYNVRCLVKRLQRIEKEMSGEARDEFAAFGIPNGDVGKFATGLAASLKKNFTDTMKLLKNEPFQKLLVDYDRKEKLFLRAIEYTDRVSSTYLVREGGIEYKPEDFCHSLWHDGIDYRATSGQAALAFFGL